MTQLTERQNILSRIRAGLATEAPVPGHHGIGEIHTDAHLPDTEEFSDWLPDPGEEPSQWLELFAKNSEMLKTELVQIDVESELPAKLAELAAIYEWKKAAAHHHKLVDAALSGVGTWERPVVFTDGGYEIDDMESCDVGISACDALIAQTGSILVTARSAGGRALSALPPHHVVVATQDQLLPDLPSAFRLVEKIYGSKYPSFIGFITGPSRTGDIERILVLGAHGPKKLTVILIG